MRHSDKPVRASNIGHAKPQTSQNKHGCYGRLSREGHRCCPPQGPPAQKHPHAPHGWAPCASGSQAGAPHKPGSLKVSALLPGCCTLRCYSRDGTAPVLPPPVPPVDDARGPPPAAAPRASAARYALSGSSAVTRPPTKASTSLPGCSRLGAAAKNGAKRRARSATAGNARRSSSASSSARASSTYGASLSS